MRVHTRCGPSSHRVEKETVICQYPKPVRQLRQAHLGDRGRETRRDDEPEKELPFATPLSSEQELPHENDRRVELIIRVRFLDEAMAFVFRHEIPDRTPI